MLDKPHWQSADDVEATELPLAKAAEKVLASMHAVLNKTMQAREAELHAMDDEPELNVGVGSEADEDKAKERHLRLTKAAEVKVVRNARFLVDPPHVQGLQAQSLDLEVDEETPAKPDELGVIKMADGEGAILQT